MTFITFEKEWRSSLEKIVAQPLLHCFWLNTLSFWENCGAKKLAGCQHPTKVKEEMLKHAAEEFRHAHILKEQIHRLDAFYPTDYSLSSLMGGVNAYHFLDRLDTGISRFLFENAYASQERHLLSYLLVTYAIERRAEEVYTLYHEVLKQTGAPIRIYSILLEEKEHLEEITTELSHLPESSILCAAACQLEGVICQQLLSALNQSIHRTEKHND